MSAPQERVNLTNVNVTTITADALRARITRPDFTIDPRFLPIKEGGVFNYLSFDPGMITPRDLFPIVEDDGIIVGVAHLQPHPDRLGIQFVSVDPSYRNRGHGRRLVEEIFRYAKEQDVALRGSSYEDDGRLKLKPIIDHLARTSGVLFSSVED